MHAVPRCKVGGVGCDIGQSRCLLLHEYHGITPASVICITSEQMQISMAWAFDKTLEQGSTLSQIMCWSNSYCSGET